MQKWKRRGLALFLVLVLLMGSWGGLLAAWHSARGMGQEENWLPYLSFGSGGGVTLTLGTKKWRLEDEKMRQGFAAAARAEWLVPHSLRITALGAATGLFLWRQNVRPAAVKRLV